jgi:lysophospholipase L1-like esterase
MIFLHAKNGEPAAGSKLEASVYVNDRLKLKQIVAGRKTVSAFTTNLGALKNGNRIYVTFRPVDPGPQNRFWFDYKINFEPSRSPAIPPAIPATVAKAFHVDTGKPFLPDAGWMSLHYQFCNYAQQHPVDLLFIGDSITAAWGIKGRGLEIWNQRLLNYHPANFGIAGQTTQDVLWRIEHRELNGLHPKAVVVMLGCNDINWPANEIAAGVTEVVRQVRHRLPDSIVILMGILPRGRQPDTIERSKVDEANTLLAQLDDDKRIHFVNFGNKLLSPDGTLSKQMSLDSIHPTTQGYVFWADAIQPFLDKIFN